MIRVALAVVLAAALVGAATPAVEDARTAATDRGLRADLSRVGAAAESLAAGHDPVPPRAGAARRTVRLVVPGAAWGRASATVVLGGAAGDGFGWRVGDGHARTVRVDVELRVWRDGTPVDGTLRFGPGRHRLVLSLVRVDGRAVVAVRGFKSDTGRSSPRVRPRRRGEGGVRVRPRP